MIDIKSIMRRAVNAASEMFEEVELAAKKSIKLERYTWPRETIRSTGEIVTSPRNKVDTGNLYREQRLERLTPFESVIINDASYALDVYVGTGSDPGSPWLKEAITASASGSVDWQNPLALTNPSEVFKDAFTRSL